MANSPPDVAATRSPCRPGAARNGFSWRVWLLIAIFAISAADLPAKFDDAQSNESTSFLPGDAESTKALAASEELQGDELAPIVIVYQRARAASPAPTCARIEADREALNADLPPRTERLRGADPLPGRQRRAAPGRDPRERRVGDTIIDPVDQAREQVDSNDEPGVETAVTGGAGFSADAIDVFESINGTLLLATAGIVFLLLLIVYRSPIFWFFPLFAVGLAELAPARRRLRADRDRGHRQRPVGRDPAGARVRRRNRLRAAARRALPRGAAAPRGQARGDGDALRRAGPAIIASGLTVIAALLCLTLADVEGTAGPRADRRDRHRGRDDLDADRAAGDAGDRRAAGRSGRSSPTSATKADETHGTWRRIGEWIARGPRRVWIGTVAVLLLMALGWLNLDTGLTQANQFRDDVESVAGQELLAESFPAGAGAADTSIVPDPAKSAAVAEALAEHDAVEDVRRRRGPAGCCCR